MAKEVKVWMCEHCPESIAYTHTFKELVENHERVIHPNSLSSAAFEEFFDQVLEAVRGNVRFRMQRLREQASTHTWDKALRRLHDMGWRPPTPKKEKKVDGSNDSD